MNHEHKSRARVSLIPDTFFKRRWLTRLFLDGHPVTGLRFSSWDEALDCAIRWTHP